MRWNVVALAVVAVCSAHTDDPELDMLTPARVAYWNYPSEVHHATTTDGFILEMHRIPYGKGSIFGQTFTKGRPVMFMQHGLESASSDFVSNLPEQSAGMVFADAGFDVWMGNIRGNNYSQNHTRLSRDSNEFWDWSWDEMVKYDLDAMIDYVLSTTGQPTLYYMGHSQGTLIMFSKLSVDQEFAKRIKRFYALAPIGSVKNIKGLLLDLVNAFGNEFDLYYNVFGQKEFGAETPLIKKMNEDVCNGIKVEEKMCDNFLMAIAGPESSKQNASRIPIYISNLPAGTSSRNIEHWMQMVKKGTVSMYDYGTKGNMKKYGQSTPPEYDFTKITAQTVIYWGDEDWLADPTDITGYLLPRIQGALVQNTMITGYNHLDFTWSIYAAKDIYLEIVQKIKAELGM
ncbi:hypothetical protein Q1695_002022 [Nippostrongylus brasiliensis]|nr:hypothetical protein Q1695_002022 [Nippostrongylus brasiliensis]